MGPAAVLNIVITANAAAAQANLARTEAQMKAVAATANKSAMATAGAWQKTGNRMNAIGKTLTRTVTLPALAVGAASVKMAMDFEHSMSLIQTQAGGSAAEVKNLTKQVMDFAASGRSTHGPKQLADALYHIESVGYRGAKAMRILQSAEALATTGAADMEETTNALVSAMRTGIKGTQNLTQTVGSLNAIVGAGNMRMDDLNAAMGTGFLSNARQMGLSLNQAGAALAALTRQGQPATAGATRLSMAFRMVMAPTDKAEKALKSIGLTAGRLGTMMQAGKFPQAMHLLVQRLDALGNSPEALQKKAQIIREMFGARSATGINTILQGLHQYDSTLTQVNRKSADFNKLHGAAMQTPANRLRAIWAQLQATLIKLGETLTPIVLDLARAFQRVASAVGSLPSWLVEGVFMGAIVLGPLTRVVGWVFKLAGAWKAVAAARAGAGAVGAAGAAGGAGVGLGAAAAAVGIPAAIAVGGGYAAYKSSGQTTVGMGGLLETQNKVLRVLGQQLNTHKAISAQEVAQDLRAAQYLQKQGVITREQQHQLDVLIQSKNAGTVGLGIGRDWLEGIKKGMREGGPALRTEIVRNTLNVTAALAQMTPQGRETAAKMMVTMANTLALQGKIPIAAARNLRKAIASQFPGMELPGINATKKLANGIVRVFNGAAQAIVHPLKTIQNLVSSFLGNLGIHVDFSDLGKLAGNLAGGVASLWPFHSGGGGKGKAWGGIVAGSGSGDTVPLHIGGQLAAMVEAGELVSVTNRRATGALMAMNGAVPRRAGGGLIEKGARRAVSIEAAVARAIIKRYGAGNTQALMREARRMEALRQPYVWGGGHAGFSRNGPWDCSGAVSQLLHGAGYPISSPMVSGGFMKYGLPGLAGNNTGIWANPSHVWATINGQGFSTSAENPGGGWGSVSYNSRPGFVKRHGVSSTTGQAAAKGYQRGGLVSGNWNKNHLTTLAAYVGMRNPALMAAIAMAESSGIPTRRGAAGEYGLWQIMPSWGGGSSLLDPIKNARKARYVLGKQGLTAWTTYKTGAYKRFLGGHVLAGLMARLRGGGRGGGTNTPGVTGSFGQTDLQPYNPDAYQAMVNAIDARNQIIGTMNDLIGAGNLEALQRYQTGLAQNPLLGIPSPNAPGLTPLRPTLPTPPPPSFSITGMSAEGFGYGLRGYTPPHHAPKIHNHFYIDGKEIKGVTKVEMRKAARKGRRKLPSARR